MTLFCLLQFLAEIAENNVITLLVFQEFFLGSENSLIIGAL